MALTRLVLFDIDGTLLWPDGAGRASMKVALIELFGTAGAIDSYQFVGHTDRETVFSLMTQAGFPVEEIEQGFAQLAPVMEYALGRLVEAGRHNIRPCPGALELIAKLDQRPDALLGLVTGNLRPTAAIKLRAAGFDPAMFKVGAFGHISPLRADLPPHAVEEARQITQVVFRDGQIVIIGDTPADVTCGASVGARSIGVLTGWTKREDMEAANPDYLLADLSDQQAALAAIFGPAAQASPPNPLPTCGEGESCSGPQELDKP